MASPASKRASSAAERIICSLRSALNPLARWYGSQGSDPDVSNSLDRSITRGEIVGAVRQTVAAQPECERNPIATGMRAAATSAAVRPAFSDAPDVGRAQPLPDCPVRALDHELKRSVVAAGHVDLPRLNGSLHARSPVVGDDGAADDHKLLVVVPDHGVDGEARIAEEVVVFDRVLADKGE